MVEATEGSTSTAMCQGAQDIGPDLAREGPFDACEVEPEPGQSPLVLNSMPGCQFHMTSYDDRDNRDDLDPAYGIHLHDPRMMEYMGDPESARILGRSPEYWLEHMGRDRAVAAALRLHHDASLIMTNVQVMSQFMTSLNRTASEVMRTVYAREPFPTDAVQFMTPGRSVRRAAHYMDRKLKNQVVVLVIGGFKPCKVFTTNVIPNRSTESPSQSRSCSTIIVDMKKRVEMK